MTAAKLRQFRSLYEVDDRGCWIWKRSKGGYGSFFLDGRQLSAHRAAWLLLRGELREGECVLHHCDVKACVNPEHLYVGTKGDNARDRERRQGPAIREAQRQERIKGAALLAMPEEDRRALRSAGTAPWSSASSTDTRGSTVSRPRSGPGWR